MSDNNEASGSDSRSGCGALLGRVGLIVGLGVLVFGIASYEKVGELFSEWTMSDEEVAQREAERKEEEERKLRVAHGERRVREIYEKLEQDRLKERKRREAQDRATERYLAEEAANKQLADFAERQKEQAFEAAMARLDGVVSAERFEKASAAASKAVAELSVRPVEPMVLLTLVGAAVRAFRSYAADKIMGGGLRKHIMEKLVHESTIMGKRPKGEKKLILEKIADSIMKWVKSAAK